MKRTHFDMHRAATPVLDAERSNVLNPAPTVATGKGMSIAELKMWPIPPLHLHPFFTLTGADQNVLCWLYGGAKPQSSEEIGNLAAFCIWQQQPNALSWLILQCEVDELTLKDRCLGAAGAQMIASWLEHCPRPIALDFSFSGIGDEGAIALAAALPTNSTLTSLDLRNNEIGATGAVALAKALKTNSTLTSLSLRNNEIGASGAAAFADALKTNSTLTSLNIRDNDIGANGAIEIAVALNTNSTLISLDLGKNGIGVGAAKAFADVLNPDSRSIWLSVGANYLGDRDLLISAHVLKGNTSLASLDLGSEWISETGAPSSNEIESRLKVNAHARPFILPAAEAFMTLPTSWESKLPLEVSALIVKEMIVRAPFEGDGVEGLRSLVIASDIVKLRSQDATV